MNTPLTAVDRRTEIKAKHRQSIIDAASRIMRERQSSEFSVDDLALAANVSRRTIFNHFASLDDVIIEACGKELTRVVEHLASISPASGSTKVPIFDDLAQTFRQADLITAMVYLTKVLGSDDPRLTPRQAQMAGRAFTEINEHLGRELHGRHPDADPLEVGLLVSTMTNGLLVIYLHWISVCGAVDSPESRKLWSQLVDRLISSLRTGFGSH